MQIIYTSKALEDLNFWKKNNIQIVNKIERLVADIQKNPFIGLGKPEPLKFAKTGYWSRRINHEHRLIYKIHSNILYIAQCRYHY